MGKPLTKSVIAKRGEALEPTDEIKALALVMLDAAIARDPRVFRHLDGTGLEISDDRRRFVDATRTEYLRQFPRCTDVPTGLIVQEREAFTADDPDPERAQRGRRVRKVEWQMMCLICRESIATIGAGGKILPHDWWSPLHYHTLECAARFVLGTIKAPRPKAWQRAKDDPKEPRKPRKRRKR